MYEELMEPGSISSCKRLGLAGFNRRIRKTVRPVVWGGAGAQSPVPDPIVSGWPSRQESGR